MSETINQQNIPSGLFSVAKNRDFITTDEVAHVFNISAQTVRKISSQTGEFYGIKPLKVGHKLLWSVNKISEKLKETI